MATAGIGPWSTNSLYWCMILSCRSPSLWVNPHYSLCSAPSGLFLQADRRLPVPPSSPLHLLAPRSWCHCQANVAHQHSDVMDIIIIISWFCISSNRRHGGGRCSGEVVVVDVSWELMLITNITGYIYQFLWCWLSSRVVLFNYSF